jgi:hypothetical protein
MGMIEQAISDQSDNTILDKIEAQIETIIKPEDKDAFLRILVAGMKVMFDERTHQMAMESVSQGDPIQGAVEGVTNLMKMLYQESRGTMPPVPAMQAAMVLMCQALGFMEKAGMVKLDNETISNAMQDLSESLLQSAGITPEKIDELLGQAQGELENQQPPEA